MKTILLSALLLAAFCGMDECRNPPRTVSEANPHVLSYIHDTRTGLCFAKHRDSLEGNSSITLVPCDGLGKITPNAVEDYK